MGWNNHGVNETTFFHQFDMNLSQNRLSKIPMDARWMNPRKFSA